MANITDVLKEKFPNVSGSNIAEVLSSAEMSGGGSEPGSSGPYIVDFETQQDGQDSWRVIFGEDVDHAAIEQHAIAGDLVFRKKEANESANTNRYDYLPCTNYNAHSDGSLSEIFAYYMTGCYLGDGDAIGLSLKELDGHKNNNGSWSYSLNVINKEI